MPGLLEYKCPNCSAAIEFDSTAQKMKCPYCDTQIDVRDLKSKDGVLEESASETEAPWDPSGMDRWQGEDAAHLRIYSCKSCGGEIVGDAVTAATSCPFCGSFVVMTGQLTGDLRPEYVIPFKKDKKAAMEAFLGHLKGKKLVPRVFKDQKHVEEIKGIYVPFWLFSGEAQGEFHYQGQKITHWSDDRYHYKEIMTYKVTRAGSVGFNKIPVDGSSKIANDLMESIEPFHWEEAVPFQTAYLSGYLADRYDVEVEESLPRAEERARQSVARAFAATACEYDHVQTERASIALSHGDVSYALCPIWLLTTRWHQKQYLFAMNGQTGTFVGDLPEDKRAYWLYFVGLTLLIGGILYGLMWLILLV